MLNRERERLERERERDHIQISNNPYRDPLLYLVPPDQGLGDTAESELDPPIQKVNARVTASDEKGISNGINK